MSRLIALALLVVATLDAGSCTPADPRRAVSEQFIDRLFIVIDQPAARELAIGLAASKIDEEIRLKTDQAIDESTRQPHIHYRFVQQAGDGQGETSSLVYELQVAPEDADAFTRRLILTLRREGDVWRIANYTLESPPGAD